MSFFSKQHSLGVDAFPEYSECTVTLDRVYRKKKHSDASSEEQEYEEDDTVRDLRSLSKLLDIPEEDLDDKITGIFLVQAHRDGGTLFVPYINMYIDVSGDEPAFVQDYGEQTVLQRIEKIY